MISEKKSLEERIDQMESELKQFENIERMKIEATERHGRVQTDFANLQHSSKSAAKNLKIVSEQHRKLKVN